jgi:hypothetical protein
MNQPALEKKEDQTIVQSLRRCVLTIGAGLLILSITAQGWAAADEQQKTFSSPEAATQKVVDALRKMIDRSCWRSSARTRRESLAAPAIR